MGRKRSDESKLGILQVRVGSWDLARIKEAAEREGKTVSEFVRGRLLGDQAEQKPAAEVKKVRAAKPAVKPQAVLEEAEVTTAPKPFAGEHPIDYSDRLRRWACLDWKKIMEADAAAKAYRAKRKST
jgi:hypothetical protein